RVEEGQPVVLQVVAHALTFGQAFPHGPVEVEGRPAAVAVPDAPGRRAGLSPAVAESACLPANAPS
ncbi:hypothetical protein ACWEF9_37320, partial [Streptomyces sp. NPDC004980]